MRPNARRIDPTATPVAEPNTALREIAGRIKKLSYRDMQRLVEVIASAKRIDVPMANTLLDAADILEKA